MVSQHHWQTCRLGTAGCDQLIPPVPNYVIIERHRDVSMLHIKDSASWSVKNQLN